MPLSFNGSNNWVDLTNGNVQTLAAFNAVSAGTLTCWFQTSSIAGESAILVYNINGVSASSRSRIKINLNTTVIGGGGRSLDSQVNQQIVFTSPGAIAAGTWYHAAVVNNYAANTITVYLNGIVVATGDVAFTAPTTSATNSLYASVGGYGNAGTFFFTGAVHDVRAYNRALSANEIQTIYTGQGQDKIIEGLVNRYIMSEQVSGLASGGSSSIKDSGPGGNNALPVNSPVYVDSILRIP